MSVYRTLTLNYWQLQIDFEMRQLFMELSAIQLEVSNFI